MSQSRPPIGDLSGTSGTIPEDRYRHDLALHDRFQDFGAELLRIASLGLAAFGFVLLTKTTEQTVATEVIGGSFVLKCLISLAPICFGLAVAFALRYRFLASDGMFHHFRAIKLIDLKDERHTDRIHKEEATRNAKFKQAERSLHISAALICGGAVLLAVAFVWIVLSMTPPQPVTKANMQGCNAAERRGANNHTFG